MNLTVERVHVPCSTAGYTRETPRDIIQIEYLHMKLIDWLFIGFVAADNQFSLFRAAVNQSNNLP